MPNGQKVTQSDVLINLGIMLFMEAMEHGPELINAIRGSSLENKEELLDRIKKAQDRLDEWL